MSIATLKGIGMNELIARLDAINAVCMATLDHVEDWDCFDDMRNAILAEIESRGFNRKQIRRDSKARAGEFWNAADTIGRELSRESRA